MHGKLIIIMVIGVSMCNCHNNNNITNGMLIMTIRIRPFLFRLSDKNSARGEGSRLGVQKNQQQDNICI